MRGAAAFIHANQDLTQMVYLGVTDNAVNIYSGSSSVVDVAGDDFNATANDGTWSLIYNVGTNTYTAYNDGVAVGLSWTDYGQLDDSRRRLPLRRCPSVTSLVGQRGHRRQLDSA
jgi:hypothetical protein